MVFVIAFLFSITLIALAMVTTSLGVWVRQTYGKFPTFLLALVLGLFAYTQGMIYVEQAMIIQELGATATNYELIIRKMVNYSVLVSSIGATIGTLYLIRQSYFYTLT